MKAKIIISSLLLLVLGTLPLGSANPGLTNGELKFEKESVFLGITVPDGTRSPTTEEFETAGQLFIERWDQMMKEVYAQDTEREYIRLEAKLDTEKS